MLDALLDNLLESGLNNATEVILTGCSGVLYHYVHSRINTEHSTIIIVVSHMIHIYIQLVVWLPLFMLTMLEPASQKTSNTEPLQMLGRV